MLDLEKNKDVILNFGLIVRGRLRDIEELQRYILKRMRRLHVVYCMVTARKLYLVKRRWEDEGGKGGQTEGESPKSV